MKKALKATQQEFESSTGKTPEYLAWHRLFKKEFTEFLTNFLGCTKVEISKPNHFDMSGFFQRPSGQIWYFRIGDIRWSKDKMLLRTAESFSDFTGGTNQYVSLKNEIDFTFQFRKLIRVQDELLAYMQSKLEDTIKSESGVTRHTSARLLVITSGIL